MRNKITKRPVSDKAPVPQEATQLKKINAAMSSVEDNVLEVEHGEDVCQEKQYHPGEDLKLRYASRLKGKDSNVVTSQKKGDVASSAIAVDGSDSDSQSGTMNKSTNDHVAMAPDLSNNAGGLLSVSKAVASNVNMVVNVEISEGSADKVSGACPRCKTLYDKAMEYFDQEQSKCPDDIMPFLTDAQKIGYFLEKKNVHFFIILRNDVRNLKMSIIKSLTIPKS